MSALTLSPADCCFACLPACLAAVVLLHTGKAVAYVKFDKASSAALAIEQLNGAVLNDGKGPRLKCLLAESPTARYA